MSNGAGAFLQGLAGGVGMGLQVKNFNKGRVQKDTSQVQAPLGTQAVQATAQNGANSSTGGMGLGALTQPGMTMSGNEASGGGMWSMLQSIIGGGGN